MKGMRSLAAILMLLLLGGVCAISLQGCVASHHDNGNEGNAMENEHTHITGMGEDESEDDSVAESEDDTEYVSPHAPIPDFVNRLLDQAEWWVDTLCVVNGTAYCRAYETYMRSKVLFDKDRVLLAGPAMQIDSFAPGCNTKFYVGNTCRKVLADFSDKNTLDRLESLSRTLPSFTRYRKDTIAGFGHTVLHSFSADFPDASAPDAGSIRQWLVRLIERSQPLDARVPDVTSTYDGDINDNGQIARFIAELYFAIKKGEFGTHDEDYPGALFSDLNLQAMVCNKRYVTYQEYAYDYDGGAHGGYTERLVSYDHVRRQEIDCDYLFKPERVKDVVSILLDEAKKTQKYSEWRPNIMRYVANRDKDGNETGEYTLPDPGLTEDGVVFSFQPYDISCFAAGTFHFSVPYSRIKHCLTEQGKWCAGLN